MCHFPGGFAFHMKEQTFLYRNLKWKFLIGALFLHSYCSEPLIKNLVRIPNTSVHMTLWIWCTCLRSMINMYVPCLQVLR